MPTVQGTQKQDAPGYILLVFTSPGRWAYPSLGIHSVANSVRNISNSEFKIRQRHAPTRRPTFADDKFFTFHLEPAGEARHGAQKAVRV